MNLIKNYDSKIKQILEKIDEEKLKIGEDKTIFKEEYENAI